MSEIILNELPAAARLTAALIAEPTYAKPAHVQQARRDLLEQAAQIAVDDARAAHEAFLAAYGRMTGILAYGTKETLALQGLVSALIEGLGKFDPANPPQAWLDGFPSAGAPLCDPDQLPRFEKRAAMPPWPSGSPFFPPYPSLPIDQQPDSPVLAEARREAEYDMAAQLEAIRSAAEGE